MTGAILNLILAALLGTLIGLEREWARKEPGIRTFTFISLGAALFILGSKLITEQYLGVLNSDPTRTLGQIVLGIGFLGAGVIVFKPKEDRVRGLTTAAMVWVTAGIGAVTGLGFYSLAVVATILVILVNLLLIPIEEKIDRILDKARKRTKIEGLKEDEE
ncbi:MgtC/SapB family protein [bacterium]|nr:MgtC/SapB family protein [bacterium]